MTEPREPKREMRYRRRGADEGPVAPPEAPYVQNEKPGPSPIFTAGRTARRTAFWLQVIVALVVIGLIAAVVLAVVKPGVAVPGAQAPASGEQIRKIVWVQPASGPEPPAAAGQAFADAVCLLAA